MSYATRPKNGSCVQALTFIPADGQGRGKAFRLPVRCYKKALARGFLLEKDLFFLRAVVTIYG